jgi:hypothetical protein
VHTRIQYIGKLLETFILFRRRQSSRYQIRRGLRFEQIEQPIAGVLVRMNFP